MKFPICILFINQISSVYHSIGIDNPYLSTTDDPGLADVILFENHTPDYIRDSAEFKKYPAKCVTVNSEDKPTYFLPGCYSSNSKHLLSGKRTRTIPYIRMVREGPNAFIKPAGKSYRYLYAFRGASSSWLRKKLFKIKHWPDDVSIAQSNNYNHWSIDPLYRQTKDELQKEYALLLDESLFFLCPRGAGSGSIRLFEVMQAGRVPVIISDKWIPIAGFEWNKFSIRIREKDISKIDRIIREHKIDAKELGHTAQEIYNQFFSPGPDLELLANSLAYIQDNRNETKESLIRFLYPVYYGILQLRYKAFAALRFLILKAFSVTGIRFPYALSRPLEK